MIEDCTKLRVASTKQMQHATFNQINATSNATEAQQTDLKALALLVLQRNKQRNQGATNAENTRNFDPQKTPLKVAQVALDVVSVAHEITDTKPIDLTHLAKQIAEETGCTADYALSMLDESDKAAIMAGDQAMVKAWRGFVGLACRKSPPRPGTNSDMGGLVVQAGTPAKTLVTIEAKSPKHAEQIRKWNPTPEEITALMEAKLERASILEFEANMPRHEAERLAGLVKCCDCIHATPTSHRALIECSQGQASMAMAGMFTWWNTDSHLCESFQAND